MNYCFADEGHSGQQSGAHNEQVSTQQIGVADIRRDKLEREEKQPQADEEEAPTP
jgi:hypothetical protein